MSESWRVALTLLVLLLFAVLAFAAARYWQATQSGYARVGAAGACELRAGVCRREVGPAAVTLSVAPADIPLMRPLRLTVVTEGLVVRGVLVEVRGLNMDMGLNRTRLEQTADGRWDGETILPVCSQRQMEWEAAVRLDADRRIEVPFAFRTVRP